LKASDTINTHHLRCRLWIAELNFFINQLRIFEDSLELRTLELEAAAVKKRIVLFQKAFRQVRSEIDELKHELHLVKMKLAALAREDEPALSAEDQQQIENLLPGQFAVLSKTFTRLREQFILFEPPAAT
jgi:septal ring factor EnvC (AmiA/AmiB activator)